MGPYLRDYPRYAWQLLNGFRVNHERAFANMRRQDIAPYLNGTHPLQMLDLGNGRLRPQYTILKAAGHRIYGIDLVNRSHLSCTEMAYRLARWLYNRKIGLSSTTNSDKTLVCGDVAALPFRTNSFDLVTSVAAFEHFLNVPAVVAELARVIRPGGLVWVCVHLFTSPSGGHDLSFTEIPLRTVPKGTDPWGHLRRRRVPFHVPLNEWRRDQYLETFANHFLILKHYCAMREGEEFLTPQIEAELSAYSRDELTCGAYVIVARKRTL
jgi:SAM-dependent methyltransferase